MCPAGRTPQHPALELYNFHPPRFSPGAQAAPIYSLLSLDQAFILMTPSSSSQLAPFHPDSHFISFKEIYFPNDSARAQCSILGQRPFILLVSLKITGKQAIFKRDGFGKFGFNASQADLFSTCYTWHRAKFCMCKN